MDSKVQTLDYSQGTKLLSISRVMLPVYVILIVPSSETFDVSSYNQLGMTVAEREAMVEGVKEALFLHSILGFLVYTKDEVGGLQVTLSLY